MAYTEIQPTAAGTPSSLGDYTFNCVFDDSPTLGQFARASMTKDGQTVYKTISLPNQANIQGYSIEANENEATVYAVLKVPEGEGGEAESDLPTNWSQPIPIYSSMAYTMAPGTPAYKTVYTGNILIACNKGGSGYSNCVLISSEPGVIGHYTVTWVETGIVSVDKDISAEHSVTRHGKTAYYSGHKSSNTFKTYDNAPIVEPKGWPDENTIWTAVYGRIPTGYTTKEVMVGRFAIDLGDAGGYPGGDSDWIEQGDWNEDPNTVLQVEVTGALSGRHNDPIYDPSYSYVPADKETIKQYGSGGDGGHGGGGGAGASTVVIHRLATNKANSHEAAAIARRHGYGSGGGKGGKGGDGIILVYY